MGPSAQGKFSSLEWAPGRGSGRDSGAGGRQEIAPGLCYAQWSNPGEGLRLVGDFGAHGHPGLLRRAV